MCTNLQKSQELHKVPALIQWGETWEALNSDSGSNLTSGVFQPWFSGGISDQLVVHPSTQKEDLT